MIVIHVSPHLSYSDDGARGVYVTGARPEERKEEERAMEGHRVGRVLLRARGCRRSCPITYPITCN